MRPRYILPVVLVILFSPIVSYAELILGYGGHRDLAVYNTVTQEEVEIINKTGEGYWFSESITRFPISTNKYIAQSRNGVYDSERKIIYTDHLWIIEIGAETKANKITQVEGAAFGLEAIIAPNEKLIFLSWLDRQNKRWTRVINAVTFEEVETTDKYYFDQTRNEGSDRYAFDEKNVYFYEFVTEENKIITVNQNTKNIESIKHLNNKEHEGLNAILDIKNSKIFIYELPKGKKYKELNEHTYSVYDIKSEKNMGRFRLSVNLNGIFTEDDKYILAADDVSGKPDKKQEMLYLVEIESGIIVKTIDTGCDDSGYAKELKRANGKIYFGQDEVRVDTDKKEIHLIRSNKSSQSSTCGK